MASFEELRKQMYSKYGNGAVLDSKKTSQSTSSQEKTEKTESSSKKTFKSDFESLREEMLKKYDRSYGVDERYIDAFVKDANSYFEKFNRSSKKTSDVDQEKDAADLRSRSFAVSQYLDENKDTVDDDTLREFRQYLDALDRTLSQEQYAVYRENQKKETAKQLEQKKHSLSEIDAQMAALAPQVRDNQAQIRRASFSDPDVQNMTFSEPALEEYKRLETLRSEKSAELNRVKQQQEGYSLAGVKNPYSDSYDLAFEKLSQYAEGLASDPVYAYINGKENGSRNRLNDEYRQSRRDIAVYSGSIPWASEGETPYQKAGYDYMTEDEISIYNYYYAKEGATKANEYLSSIQETLNQRKATDQFSDFGGNTGLELLFGVSVGLDQYASGVKSLVSREDYVPQSSTQMLSGMIREDLADVGWRTPEWMGGDSLGQMAYDAVTVTANMAPSVLSSMVANAVIPGSGTIVGNTVMFAGAAGNAYQEALNLGYSKEQSRMYSTLIGASEVGLQAALGGISALGGTGKWTSQVLDNIDNSFLRIAGKLVANGVSEGFEEFLQEILTPMFKELSLKSEEELSLSDAVYSFMLGALTSGLLEGGNTISSDRSTSRAGQQLLDSGVSAERLSELGKTYSADSVAYELAGKVDENTGAYTLGRMFNAIGACLTEQNQADIQQMLVEKGFTETQAASSAKVFAQVVEGAVLSGDEAAVLEINDVLSQTVQEVIIDANTTVYQRTKGYSDMLKALAGEAAGGTATAISAESSRLGQPQAQTAAAAPETRTPKPQEAAAAPAQQNNGAYVVESLSDGNVMLRWPDGSTVSAREVDLGEMEPIYEAVSKLDTTAGDANVIIQSYDRMGEVTPAQYAAQIGHAYRLGKMGIAPEQVEISELTRYLTDGQRENAYRLGREAAQREVDRKQEQVRQQQKNPGKNRDTCLEVSDEIWKNATDTQRDQIEVIGFVADALEVAIQIYESETVNGRRLDASGWYNREDGSVHIDIHAGMDGQGVMLYTLSHELTHHLRMQNPAGFKRLADFLMEEYGHKGIQVEQLIDAKLDAVRRTYQSENLSEDALYDIAYEEVVADSMEPMLTDGRVIQKLKVQEQSIWDQMKNFIHELAEKIRAYYARLKPDSVEGRHVLDMKDSIEHIEDLFLQGLEETRGSSAAQKRSIQEGGTVAASVRYSTRDAEISVIQSIGRKSINQFTSEELKKTERLANRYWQEMGEKSPFFRAWFGDWRAYDTSAVQIADQQGQQRGKQHNEDTGWEINVSRKVFSETNAHNSGYNISARPYLPYLNDIIKKAVLLDSFSMGTDKVKSPNSLLMHSLYAVADIGNGPEILKLYVEEMNDPNQEDTAKRAYQLQNIEKYRPRQRSSQGSASSISAGSDALSVADLFSSVKAKDSQFKPKQVNSLFLNEDGTPKVFYHGTPNGDFAVFKDWQHFTDSREYADRYQGQGASSNGYKKTARKKTTYKVYLSPKKIFDTRNPREKRIFMEEFFQKWGNGAPLSERGVPDWTDGDDLAEFFEDEGYDYDAFLLDEGGTGGYGENVQDRGISVVIRDSSAIKSTTDNVGTFDRGNADIRYQERNPDLNQVNSMIREENALMRDDLDTWHQVFAVMDIGENDGIFTQGSVNGVSRKLMEIAGAQGKAKELSGILMDAYTSLTARKSLNWADVNNKLTPAVDWLMAHRKVELDSRAQDALRTIRKSRVFLDAEQKQEAAFLYGSYNEYRKMAMGKVILAGTDSVSLDSLWQGLAEDYPDVFPLDTNSNDMVQGLLDGVARLRKMTTDVTMGINQIALSQDLLREVYDGMFLSAVYPMVGDQLLSAADQRLMKMTGEHEKQIRKLTKANEGRIQKLVQQHNEQMAAVKNLHAAEIRGLQNSYQRRQEWRKAGREKTELRHKIQRTAKWLNSMILRESKTRHIPEGMKVAVVNILDAVNMDTVVAEERVKQLEEQLSKTTDPYEAEELRRKIFEVRDIGGRVTERIEKLKAAYAAFAQQAADTAQMDAGDVVMGLFDRFGTEVKDAPLRNMSKAQLELTDELLTAVHTSVLNANETFATEKAERIDGLGKAVISELNVQKQKPMRPSATSSLRQLAWNNLKPIYAHQRIDSQTLTRLFENLRKGEDIWARDMQEAQQFRQQLDQQFGGGKWNTRKTYEFTDRTNKTFRLNLGQMLTLYAYSKREQSWEHLQKGGFVFKVDPKEHPIELKEDATTDANGNEVTVKKWVVSKDFSSEETFKVDAAILGEIIGKLSPEQKRYADRMQAYLSDTMGAKGNEVSLKMYGIKLFKERNYFPLKSAKAFLIQETQKTKGEVKIKNKGFTKDTTPQASNPVYLQDFWATFDDHVNEMSLYHGMTLPMEDYYRVRNFKEGIFEEEGSDVPDQSKSVTSAIQSACGMEATAYLDRLLKDLNGGVISDSRESIGKKLSSLHKKAAVMASMSVIVQQPTSIYRAMGMVDMKYFGTDSTLVPSVARTFNGKKHQALWEELKTYAPVAIIKEMGGFDTNVGRNARDYLNGNHYDGLRQKVKAFAHDGSYRDELLAKLPALADEMAWVSIWMAVKKETQAKNPGLLKQNREAFMQKAGERFTEVVTRTQVYDSVFSRSDNMRSKSFFMNMATAFMAEPTTTANMVEDAARRWIRGDKKAAMKLLGGVAASTIVNAALVSIVYAMRDDNKDATFAEKYFGRLATELLDGFNPLTYLPYAKDIWSIMQGYDVERSDMVLISDLISAVANLYGVLEKDTSKMDAVDLVDYEKSLKDALWAMADILFSFGGIPAKNARRDAVSVLQLFTRDKSGKKTTKASLVDSIAESVSESIPGAPFDPGNKGDKLYRAILAGDQEYIRRLKGQYSSDSSYLNAKRRALYENDPRIHTAAAAKLKGDLTNYTKIANEIKDEKHFTQDDVVTAIKYAINDMLTEEKAEPTQKAKSLYDTDDLQAMLRSGNNTMVASIRKELIRNDVANGKTQEEAEKGFSSDVKSAVKDSFLEEGMTKDQAVSALTEHAGLSQEEAERKVSQWAFEKEHGVAYDDRKEAYLAGDVSRAEMIDALMDAGKTEEQAEDTLMVYDWQKEEPDSRDITAPAIEDYNAFCASAGISKKQYYEAWKGLNGIESDRDADGGAIKNSKTRKVMAYINALDLTSSQKMALALTQYKSSTVQKYRLW